MHKTSPPGVEATFFPAAAPDVPSDLPDCIAVAQFLTHLTPRMVKVAAGYLDGQTQAELAEAHGIDQATVSRDLQTVRRVCQRFGKSLPQPLRVRARDEVQISENLYRVL